MSVPEEWFLQAHIALYRKCMVDPVTGCHVWTGGKKNYGRYGVISFKNHRDLELRKSIPYSVHRLAYMVATRQTEIPDRLHVSHLCHQGLCMNIEHLKLEPPQVNNGRIACYNAVPRRCLHIHHPYPDCKL